MSEGTRTGILEEEQGCTRGDLATGSKGGVFGGAGFLHVRDGDFCVHSWTNRGKPQAAQNRTSKAFGWVRGSSRGKLWKQFFRPVLRAGCDFSSWFSEPALIAPSAPLEIPALKFFLLLQPLQLLHWLYLTILLQLFPFSLPWKRFKSFSKVNSSLTVLPWHRMFHLCSYC